MDVKKAITLDDPEGVVFNVTGFPHWDNADLASNIWERGPLACTTDPCGTPVLKEGFFSCITTSKKELLIQDNRGF